MFAAFLAIYVTEGARMRSHRQMIAAVMFVAASMQAQSLGDIARQQHKAKTQQATPTSNKVLTNDDLTSPSSVNDGKAAIPKPAHSSEPVEQKAKIISAEEFTNKISKQKQRIALLQDAIDKLQGSIQYVQNNRNIYVNAPEYNQAQKHRQAEVDELRGRLEGAKNDLSDLQEQARQAGYGSAVYQ